MAKTAFKNRKILFTSKFDLKFRENLVNDYSRGVTSNGAEIWTHWKIVQKYLEIFQMLC